MTALIWSQKYERPCVVAYPTDDPDAVIAACRAGGAVMPRFEDHGNGDVRDVEDFIVQVGHDAGPELWDGAALRRALGRRF